MTVKKGDTVKVEYTGTFEDGEVFDSTEKHGGEPLAFEVGAGKMIPGFDEGVLGMAEGEEKELTIEAAKAYGDHNPELIKEVPKDKLPQEKPLEAGMMLAVGLPNGQQLPAKITEVNDASVKIDLNHPLAGKKLHFKIKVVGIEAA
jgi:peptidylprolyl isomerase